MPQGYTDPQHPARPMYFLPLPQHVNYPNGIMATFESQSHFIHGILLKPVAT